MAMATSEQWKKRVAAWKRSGLTARQFALRHGLSAQQLHNWSSKLGAAVVAKGKRKGPMPTVSLLRVVPQKRAQAASTVRLRIGTATVDVDCGFDEARLHGDVW